MKTITSRSAGALALVAAAAYLPAATAQSACSAATPSYAAPSVAAGWEATLVGTDLESPRGLLFDSSGNLLVVEQRAGVVSYAVGSDDAGCVQLSDRKEVIENDALNHGIELSTDGRTLYASGAESVWRWSYDPETREVSGDPVELVNGMSRRGHSSRTLLLSRKVENRLLVSWGSQSNIDEAALDVATGVSQIRAFDVGDTTSPLDYASDGILIGWGLRNSVGVAEHPDTGGVFSVENSADRVNRSDVDVHQNNPGEELNYHAFLNITEASPEGRNHGYPRCLAAWNLTEIPESDNLQVGAQFAHGDEENPDDASCADETVAPVLTFAAHMAPLDIKFNNSGSEAWISFHGSWNRDIPIGYKLSVVEFANGMPVEPPNSTTAAVDIMSNPDVSACPDACFRPTGLAVDGQGRLFMTSDETGEIWVIRRTSPETDIPAPSGTATETSPGPTETGGAVGRGAVSYVLMIGALIISLLPL